jgi:hypothetical protein
VKVLIWHVHGSWTTNFVHGAHTYLIPVVDDRGPDGRGRAATWDWPASAVEVTPDELVDTPVDVIVFQRPEELELAEKWLGGRRPGRDVPAVWLEHNAPLGAVDAPPHPAVDRDDIALVVHVTHTNALYWDTGSLPVRVIEHGVVDPRPRWTGERRAAAVVINEPLRRWRRTGTDLLAGFASEVPIDLFGMGADEAVTQLCPPPCLNPHEDLPQHELHRAMARRRCYLHPYRWSSLGLSLIEAMHLGMPVVALATTEVPRAVPHGCGIVSNSIAELRAALCRLMVDDDHAARLGAAARAAALDRYGLDRFLNDWNDLLESL